MDNLFYMKPTKNVLLDRHMTVRQAIQSNLERGPATALDLSGMVRIPEKEVASHLEHLAKSVKHDKKKLEIIPATCLNCDFVFEERRRFTKPSSCPSCKRSRIDAPRFQIV